jgi:hypothetical protein
VNIHGKVFVDLRTELFHAVDDCSERGQVTHWCSAASAYRSRLFPCANCGNPLMGALRQQIGSIPSGARRGLRLPTLHALPGRADDDTDTDESDTLRYGESDDPDDPRFHSRSSLGWGTASFGRDPDEFMGGPTDDDNDWRGNNTMHE